MGDIKTIVTHPTTVTSSINTGDGVFNPVTGYMNASEVDKLRCTFEVLCASDTSGIIKPGLQTADVENAPDTAVVIAGTNSETGNGFNFPGAFSDVSADTEGKQLVRLGFWFLASSAALKAARVSARWQIKKN